MTSTTSCTTSSATTTPCTAGVYESKSHNPVIASLAKEAMKTLYMTHPEVAPELLTLQRLPCLSPENLSLSRTLHLTQTEMALLQEICQKWHFSKEIILQTLLGVDLTRDILGLQLPPKIEALVLHSFASPFFSSFLRLDRDGIADIRSRQTIPSKGTICDKLGDCKRFISQAVGVTNPTSVNIGNKIDLFIKIFQEDHSKMALADKKLLCFVDVDMPEHRTLESRLINTKDLQHYAVFCHALVTSAHKDKLLPQPYEVFQHLSQFCERAQGSLDPLVLGEMKTYLCDVLQTLADERIKSSNNVDRAKETRETRMLDKRLTAAHLENLTQSLESHSTYNILTSNLDFFVSEFQTLFDLQVIIPSFPDFAPVLTNMQRFLLNIGNCPQSLPKHKKKKAQEGQLSLVADFENYLSEKLKGIESLCKNLLEDPEFQKFQTNSALKIFQQSYQLGYWIRHLSPMKEYNNLLPEIKRRLANVPAELMLFLQNELAELPSNVTADEKRALCEKIEEVCFRKSLFLTRMLMILEDVDTIIHNRFSAQAKFLPTELEDVIILSNLEDLFTAETVEEQQTEPPSPPTEPESPTAAPQVVVHIANILPPGVVKGSGLQKPPLKPKVYPPVSSDLTRLTKTDKILKMLRKCGFFETKDSGHQNPGHTILADAQGRIVPVPRRSEQKPGTVKAMYAQATAPLREGKK